MDPGRRPFFFLGVVTIEKGGRVSLVDPIRANKALDRTSL